MMLTLAPDPVPYDQAFEAIKSAIDALPAGVKLFINSGTFAVQINSQNHHSSVFQESFMAMAPQRQTWTCSLHSMTSTPDMRIRPSYPSKEV
jgi:hypothetical protein